MKYILLIIKTFMIYAIYSCECVQTIEIDIIIDYQFLKFMLLGYILNFSTIFLKGKCYSRV